MSGPDASGAFRQHLLPSVVALSLSGSIAQPQRDVLALVVLSYVRIRPDVRIGLVEGFAGELQPELSDCGPYLLGGSRARI
jgi:hypothetical protein